MRKEKSDTGSSFVTKVDPKLANILLKDLKKQGFEMSTPPYTFFQAKKKGISCTFYQSGKLLVQGKEMGSFIEFYLEPRILHEFTFRYQDLKVDKTARIGIDESGKGDFFGPLCVAGVYADADAISKLAGMGVKDSKKLSEPTIKKIAAKIRQSCLYHIVKINPLKYNELIQQFGNLNHLLAWGHATTIEHLVEKSGCCRVIIDQFANERVVLTALKRKKLELDISQRHRAETDVVVAAASILARCAYVEAMKALEEKYGQPFPKGASTQTIAAAIRFCQKYGENELKSVSKLHFKTLDAILGRKRE